MRPKPAHELEWLTSVKSTAALCLPKTLHDDWMKGHTRVPRHRPPNHRTVP